MTKIDDAETKYLNLDYDSWSKVTREATRDEWDRDDTYTSWDVNGLELSDKMGYMSVPADFDVNVGDKIYVIYAIYSTGNSFGHDEAGRLEFIAAFKSEEKAEKAYEIIRNAGENYSVEIEHESGMIEPVYIPWNGYFESLNDLVLTDFIVS